VPRELLPGTQKDLHICKLLSYFIIYKGIWYKKIFYKEIFLDFHLHRHGNPKTYEIQHASLTFTSPHCTDRLKVKQNVKKRKIKEFSKKISFYLVLRLHFKVLGFECPIVLKSL
jgi:hypothetical protein